MANRAQANIFKKLESHISYTNFLQTLFISKKRKKSILRTISMLISMNKKFAQRIKSFLIYFKAKFVLTILEILYS